MALPRALNTQNTIMVCNCWVQTSRKGKWRAGKFQASQGWRGMGINRTRKTGTVPRYAWCPCWWAGDSWRSCAWIISRIIINQLCCSGKRRMPRDTKSWKASFFDLPPDSSKNFGWVYGPSLPTSSSIQLVECLQWRYPGPGTGSGRPPLFRELRVQQGQQRTEW